MTDTVETIRCSNCKRDILSPNFVIHDVHCQRNIYLCPKCNEPVNHNQRAEHEANHVSVVCTCCHAQVEKYLLKKHLKENCAKRKIKCDICGIEGGARDIAEHENYCGARTEKCSECGEYVMLKYKQLHLDSNHTFIRLSDEAWPSPSWQNGRRTLGNFIPDLQSGLYNANPSHQKKRLGWNEHRRRRAKGSPEFVDIEEKMKELNGPNGKQKHSGYQRNVDNASCSHSRDCRRRVSSGGNDFISGRSRASDEVEKSGGESNEINSAEGVNTDLNAARSKGKERPRRISGSSQKSKHGQSKQGNDLPSDRNKTEDDLGLAAAMQLAEEINADFHLDDELIAQAIDKYAADLSEFSLFDKNKVKTDATDSKSVYSGKKPFKTTSSKPQLNGDDSSDEELLQYSKSSGRDVGDASLPCQFCNSMYPSYALMSHQRDCKLKGEYRFRGTDKYPRKASAKNEEEELIPCDICYRLIPFSQYDSHQTLIHSSSTKK